VRLASSTNAVLYTSRPAQNLREWRPDAAASLFAVELTRGGMGRDLGRVRAGVGRWVVAAKELQLLRCLIDHRGQVLTRERILSQVWKEPSFITIRTVDVHVAWLRQKLEENPQSPKHILTVRGEGYRFKK
jgi:DNA-binding response OmpR family regulator